jgi:hypothetical protein
MKKSKKKGRQPQQWIIKFLLILAVLAVVKGQDPHDILMLLQVLLQSHH